MTFGQVVLPSGELKDIDIRKAFIEVSRHLNSLGGIQGAVITSDGKASASLPDTRQSSGQSVTILNTNSSAITIAGKANGYSAWSLDSPNDWWQFWSDGHKWYCVGGSTGGSTSNGSWVKRADGTAFVSRHRTNISLTSTSSFAGNTYYYAADSWTFPISGVSGICCGASGDVGGVYLENHQAFGLTATGCSTEHGAWPGTTGLVSDCIEWAWIKWR